MELIWGAVLGILAFIAWEIGGALLVQVIGSLLGPVIRPLKVLLEPPYGLVLLIITWGTAAVLAWLYIETERDMYTLAALGVASVGLVLTLIVRDQYRSKRGLPPVRTRIRGEPSRLQRTAFLFVGVLLVGIGAPMVIFGDIEHPEMWLFGAGELLIGGYFGFAAITGRLRGPVAWMVRPTAAESEEGGSSGA